MIPLSQMPKVLEEIKRRHVGAVRDTRGMLIAVDRTVREQTVRNFRRRMTPDGKPWAPPKRPPEGESQLVLTGGLFAAATGPGEIKEDTVRRWVRHPLAHIHMLGTRKGPKRKQRPGRKPPNLGLQRARDALQIARQIKKAADAAKRAAEGRPLDPKQALKLANFRTLHPRRKRKRRRRGRIGPFRIPPRPFVGFGVRDANEIAEVIADRVVARAG